MTSKRDLGPILAIAGAVVVVAAVIAGFIAVGGPGDARDRRLDEMTLGRMSNIVAAAQCAFTLEGAAPPDLAGLSAAMDRVTQRAATDDRGCDVYGSTPLADDVEYSRLADDRIHLCGDFRRPFDPDNKRPGTYTGRPQGRFSQLSKAHPAGRHCYEIQLVKAPAIPAN
jgi:hypothetical protein